MDFYNIHYYRDGLIKTGIIVLACISLLALVWMICRYDSKLAKASRGVEIECSTGMPSRFRLGSRCVEGEFGYATIDGHEYLVFKGYECFGMTHSPRCGCLKKEEE